MDLPLGLSPHYLPPSLTEKTNRSRDELMILVLRWEIEWGVLAYLALDHRGVDRSKGWQGYQTRRLGAWEPGSLEASTPSRPERRGSAGSKQW